MSDTPVDARYGSIPGPVTFSSTPPTWGVKHSGMPPISTASPEQAGALDVMKYMLTRYGLESLTDWAWQMIQQGASPEQVQIQLYDRPEFKARFPAIEERRLKGLPPISADEYIAYEDQARQVMRAAGFPSTFYDQPEDFHKAIANDESIQEMNQRATLYTQAAYEAPAEARNQLRQLYGIDEGHIAAYFADPERALPLIQQKFAASQIAGQAQRQQFGQLSTGEAERLASLGVNEQQAAQGFAQVQQMGELFHKLPGESQTTPDRAAALGLVGGDATAQQAIDLQARRRKAQFQGGGGYAQSQRGTSGLGSAAT